MHHCKWLALICAAGIGPQLVAKKLEAVETKDGAGHLKRDATAGKVPARFLSAVLIAPKPS